MCEINFMMALTTLFPNIGIYVFRWFIFRVMLSAGLVKWFGSSKWKDLDALRVHYFTQPLPNYLSYYFHNFPLWFHQFTCFASLFGQQIFYLHFFLGRKGQKNSMRSTYLSNVSNPRV